MCTAGRRMLNGRSSSSHPGNREEQEHLNQLLFGPALADGHRRWMASSGYRPVAASVTTHTSVRVLRSRPGRVQSAPNTVSVATSMNVFMMGSPYTPRFTRST